MPKSHTNFCPELYALAWELHSYWWEQNSTGLVKWEHLKILISKLFFMVA